MTEDQVKLLKEWQDDAAILLYANFAMAEACRRKSTALGGISAVLSAIVGTAVFASIGKSPHLFAQIAVGLTSVIAAVLAALHSFLNLAELASKHQKNGAGYAAIRKRIEELLVIPPGNENETKREFQSIRERWDELRADAIPMSAATLRKHKGSIR